MLVKDFECTSSRLLSIMGLSYLTETFLGEGKHGHLMSQVIKMLDIYEVFFVCYTLVVL